MGDVLHCHAALCGWLALGALNFRKRFAGIMEDFSSRAIFSIAGSVKRL